MNTCVPPSIVPTAGNTTRFPVLKKAEEKRVKQVVSSLGFFLPICSDAILAFQKNACGLHKYKLEEFMKTIKLLVIPFSGCARSS